MRRPRNPFGVRAGFSLLEVLIAMAIFALGFVAVAAIFPAGVMLQKQTYRDVTGERAGRNFNSIAAATPLSYDAENWDDEDAAEKGELDSALYFYHMDPEEIGDFGSDALRNVDRGVEQSPGRSGEQGRFCLMPFPSGSEYDGPGQEGQDDWRNLDSLDDIWPLASRGYGLGVFDTAEEQWDNKLPARGQGWENPQLTDADFLWLPMIRNRSGVPESPNWRMYVFVLEHNGGRIDHPRDTPDAGYGLIASVYEHRYPNAALPSGADSSDPAVYPQIRPCLIKVAMRVEEVGLPGGESERFIEFDHPNTRLGLAARDLVVDEFGRRYRIARVTPNPNNPDQTRVFVDETLPAPDSALAPAHLWYAPPADTNGDGHFSEGEITGSPLRAVHVVTPNVKVTNP